MYLRNQMLLQSNHHLFYDSNFSHFKLTANKQECCSHSGVALKAEKSNSPALSMSMLSNYAKLAPNFLRKTRDLSLKNLFPKRKYKIIP